MNLCRVCVSGDAGQDELTGDGLDFDPDAASSSPFAARIVRLSAGRTAGGGSLVNVKPSSSERGKIIVSTQVVACFAPSSLSDVAQQFLVAVADLSAKNKASPSVSSSSSKTTTSYDDGHFVITTPTTSSSNSSCTNTSFCSISAADVGLRRDGYGTLYHSLGFGAEEEEEGDLDCQGGEDPAVGVLRSVLISFALSKKKDELPEAAGRGGHGRDEKSSSSEAGAARTGASLQLLSSEQQTCVKYIQRVASRTRTSSASEEGRGRGVVGGRGGQTRGGGDQNKKTTSDEQNLPAVVVYFFDATGEDGGPQHQFLSPEVLLDSFSSVLRPRLQIAIGLQRERSSAARGQSVGMQAKRREEQAGRFGACLAVGWGRCTAPPTRSAVSVAEKDYTRPDSYVYRFAKADVVQLLSLISDAGIEDLEQGL